MDQKTMLKVLGPAAAVGLLVLLLGLVMMPPGEPSKPKAAPAPAATETVASTSDDQSTEGTTLTLPPLDGPEWKPGPEGGLKVWDSKEGTGEAVPEGATVKVHYTGWLTDGTIFDSSVQRNDPIEFSLNGVIRGWTVGLPGMKVGGIRRLYIPADMAYGGQRQGKIPPNSPLVFEVKMLGFTK